MGSFGGSLFQGMAGGIMQAHPILEAIGTVSSSTLSGGIGAELTGGDFWRGAATGAIVGLLNHEGDKIKKTIANLAIRKTQKLINLSNIKIEVNTTQVKQNNKSPITIVVDLKTRKPEEIQSNFITMGVDGGITVGPDMVQVGSDGLNYIFSFSTPSVNSTNHGLTIKLNMNMVNKIGIAVGTFILLRKIPAVQGIPQY